MKANRLEEGEAVMAKYSKLYAGLIVFLLSFTVGTISFAQEEATEAEKPTCDASLTFSSKYVWRGFELSKDSLVMFPEVTVSYKGFGFCLWGDFDFDYEGANTGNNGSEWWETDMVLTYGNSIGMLNYTLGWIYYDVDGADDEELFVVLGLDTFLSPEFSIWKGIEHGDDTLYINLGVSHSFELANGMSIDVGGWISYADFENWYTDPVTLASEDVDDLADGCVWAGLNIPLNDWCTLTPAVNYVFPLSDDYEDLVEQLSFDYDWVNMRGGDSGFFFACVTLAVSF